MMDRCSICDAGISAFEEGICDACFDDQLELEDDLWDWDDDDEEDDSW
jgi:hypothetical protein